MLNINKKHISLVKQIHWFCISQIGFDLKKTYNFLKIFPIFIVTIFQSKRKFLVPFSILPALHDFNSPAGETNSEYFWQDLLVAQLIQQARPQSHLDIGSRFDGFIAHVGSFRKINVLDIRKNFKKIKNINYTQGDITDPLLKYKNKFLSNKKFDSISSLHVFEHLGLGRYGDNINPDSYIQAIKNISNLLKTGGKFYLSSSFGNERVFFNSHRIFDFQNILKLAKQNKLLLQSLFKFKNNIGFQSVKIANLKNLNFKNQKNSRELLILIFEKN